MKSLIVTILFLPCIGLAGACDSGATGVREGTSPNNAPVIASLQTNPIRAPQSTKDEPSTERSGCCSHHSGVCGCSMGHTMCCDGTTSPSCTCD